MLIVAGNKEPLEKAIRAIVKEFGETVLKDLQGIKSVADLSSKVKELRSKVEELELMKARKEEEFARREREIEHKVGLERKRQAFEIESATQTATLKVREENLKADQKRFEEQMKFHETRFTEEVGYLKGMIEQILGRLPEVSVNGELSRSTRRSTK